MLKSGVGVNAKKVGNDARTMGWVQGNPISVLGNNAYIRVNSRLD